MSHPRKLLVYKNAVILTPDNPHTTFTVSGEEEPRQILEPTDQNLRKHFGKNFKLSDLHIDKKKR